MDQIRLAFMADGEVYIPLALNCGLKVAPWFFTCLLRPVVQHLRGLGHKVFAYLDDLFGVARSRESTSDGTRPTALLGRYMKRLFEKLGLWLHPEKVDFSGKKVWKFWVSWSTPAGRCF